MNEIATIVSIVFKGMMIGIIASAPMGPVGVLCLQRTLNKGRWYGFVTGCGAALSDLFYALITGYGMSFVFDYVSNNVFYLQLFGSILLLIFGIHTFRSNPVKALRAGLFARFSFVSEGMLVSETVTGYVAIVAGALLWWFLLSTGVSKVRTQFNLRGIWIINRTIGVIVIIVAVVGLIITFLGESLY